MGSKSRKKQGVQSCFQDFVTVAFAEDMELARQYKDMLAESNIPAAIKSQNDSSSGFPGIAVMVAEEHLDEAHVLIESYSSHDSFYNFGFQEDEYDDEDPDLYDDEI